MDGRRIKIILKSGDFFNGTLISQDEETICFIDRFGDKVTLRKEGILVLKEANK